MARWNKSRFQSWKDRALQLRSGMELTKLMTVTSEGDIKERKRRRQPYIKTAPFSRAFIKQFGDRITRYPPLKPKKVEQREVPLQWRTHPLIRKWTTALVHKYYGGEYVEQLHGLGWMAGLTAMKRHNLDTGNLRQNRELVGAYIEYALYLATVSGTHIEVLYDGPGGKEGKGRKAYRYVPFKDADIASLINNDGRLNFREIWQREFEFGYEAFGAIPSDIDAEPIVGAMEPQIEHTANKYVLLSRNGVALEDLIQAAMRGVEEAIEKYRITQESLRGERARVLRHMLWEVKGTAGVKEGIKEEEIEITDQLAAESGEKRNHLEFLLRKFLKPSERDELQEELNRLRLHVYEEADFEPLAETLTFLTGNIERYKRKKPWQFAIAGSKYPTSVWVTPGRMEYAAEAVRWITEEKLKLRPEDAHRLKFDDFRKHGLSSVVINLFGGSVYQALANAYPKLYDGTEDTRKREGVWEREDAMEVAVRRLRTAIEESGIREAEIPEKVDLGFLQRHGLHPAYSKVFHGDIFDFVDAAYPEQFKQWQFALDKDLRANIATQTWFSPKSSIYAAEATRWLVEEKLGLDPMEAIREITFAHFQEHGLRTMLEVLFWNDPFRALINAYRRTYSTDELRAIEEERKKIYGGWSEEELATIIEKFERLAWKYARNRQKLRQLPDGMDQEDIVQIGRIGTWRAIMDHRIDTPEKVEEKRELIVRYMITAMRTALREGTGRILDKYIYPVIGRESGERGSRNELWVEALTEKQMQLYGHTVWLPRPGPRRLRFFDVLKRTLKPWEYKSLEDEIYTTLNEVEYKAEFFRTPWDPLEEAVKILQKVPRLGEIQRWEIQDEAIWDGPEGYVLAAEATRHLFEKNSIPLEKIPEVVDEHFFRRNGLGRMLAALFKGDPSLAIENAYPGQFKAWEFKYAPQLWKRKSARNLAPEATKWMVEEKMGLKPEESLWEVTFADFKEHGLQPMLTEAYRGKSYFDALVDAYPELYGQKLKTIMEIVEANWPKERVPPFRSAPVKTRIVQDIIQDIEDVTAFDPVQIAVGYLHRRFPYLQDKHPWEFKYENRWQTENAGEMARQAVRWMIEQKEGMTPEAATQRLSEETFRRYGLEDMLEEVFHNSIYKAIEAAYPYMFKPWSVQHGKQDVWRGGEGKALAKEAVSEFIAGLHTAAQALVTEKPFREIRQMLHEQGLGEMLADLFHGSVYGALKHTYPDIRPWEGRRIDHDWHGTDTQQIVVDAVRWMVAEEGIPEEEIPVRVNRALFDRYNLVSLPGLQDSVYHVVNLAYPHQFRDFQFIEHWDDSKHFIARIATKWLARKQLKIPTTKDIPTILKEEDFRKHGLGPMLNYFGSVYAAVENAYPGIFKREQFERKEQAM